MTDYDRCLHLSHEMESFIPSKYRFNQCFLLQKFFCGLVFGHSVNRYVIVC